MLQGQEQTKLVNQRATALVGNFYWSLGLGDVLESPTEEGRQPQVRVQVDGQAALLNVESLGLSLDQKIELERILLARLSEEFSLGDLEIRFVKSGNPKTGEEKASPAPSTAPPSKKAAEGPFGLKRNLRPIPGVKFVLAVASGKGGVGKSTVSSNLAVALARQGLAVGLLDADVYGPSMPLMLGVDQVMPVNEEDRLVPVSAHGVACVSFGFMTGKANPVLWRGPMVAKALKQFCYDVAWGELDVLVIDLPPGTGDVQLALLESIPIDEALIVSTPQDVALIDAHKALSMFEKTGVSVAGFVENMSMHVCSRCGHHDPVFGEAGGERFQSERSLATLAKIPLDRQVRLAGDAGSPIALDNESPVGQIFSALADTIGCQIDLVH